MSPTNGSGKPRLHSDPPEKARDGSAAWWHRLTTGLAPLITMAFLVFLIPASAPLTDGDSAFYGRIALEMVQSGDWLTPSYPPAGPDYIVDKPPLTLWLMAASFSLLGPTAFAARIWQIAMSVGSLLLTVAIARLYLPRQAAHWSGWILLTSFLVYYTGLVPQQDVATLFFMELAFYGFLRFLIRGGIGWYYLVWIALAGGVLTRGLANLSLAGGTLAIFLVLQRPSLKRLFRGAARAAVHLSGGFLVFLLFAVPWFYAEAQILGRPFLETFFLGGNARFYEAGHNIFVTALGYSALLLVAFLPWSGYLPHSITEGIRRARAASNEPATTVARFVLVWAAFSFLFIHVIAWRVIRYLLPVLPALALLAADLHHRLVQTDLCRTRPKVERIVRWITAPLMLLVGSLGVAVWAVQLPPETAVFRPFISAVGLPMGVGGIWALLRSRKEERSREKGEPVSLPIRLVSTGLATCLALGIVLLSAGRTAFPQAEIAQELLTRVGQQDRIVYTGANPPVFYDFYLRGRDFERAGQGWTPSLDEGEVLWVITTPTEAERLHADGGFAVSEVCGAPGEVLIRLSHEPGGKG